MIKLIAFDIDGTLNNSNHEISIKTKEVIMEAQRKGIIVVLASGRPESGDPYLQECLCKQIFSGS